MDGLSVAASIIAVVQITSSVIRYLSDVKNAPKECDECMIELSNSNVLLLQLKSHLDKSNSHEPWYAKAHTLNVKNGLLDQYKLALEHLLAKVESTNKVKLVHVLMWASIKNEVASILARTERLKTFISVELGMDHL